MQHLPMTPIGYHKPWFVKGKDLREPDQKKFKESMTRGRCWICGGANKKDFVFVTDVISAAHQRALEPPCHLDCALYSIKVCPFLLLPRAKRRDSGLPQYLKDEKPEEMTLENPGIFALTHVKKFKFSPISSDSKTKWANWKLEHVTAQSLWSEGQLLQENPHGPLPAQVLKAATSH